MKLLLIFTSLFALGNMEQPLHVYTSEEIRLDELAKLDELGNTGNGKKEAVDPKEESAPKLPSTASSDSSPSTGSAGKVHHKISCSLLHSRKALEFIV